MHIFAPIESQDKNFKSLSRRWTFCIWLNSELKGPLKLLVVRPFSSHSLAVSYY